MENQKMGKSNSKIMVAGALFAGGVIGAIIGMLFAPHRGTKTRNLLASGATDMANDIKDKIKVETKSFLDKAIDYKSLVEEKVDQLVGNLKSKSDGINHLS